MGLPRANPVVAMATFTGHLDQLWANRGLAERGWARETVDDLHVVVTIPAHRTGEHGEVTEPFHVLLGAEYYDLYPPTVMFVSPEAGWPRARKGSRWWPNVVGIPWLGLHDDFQYPDGPRRQLVCFSMTAEYYMTGHNPTEAQRWRQGTHTVAATLNRLADVLSSSSYRGPDNASHL